MHTMHTMRNTLGCCAHEQRAAHSAHTRTQTSNIRNANTIYMKLGHYSGTRNTEQQNTARFRQARHRD